MRTLRFKKCIAGMLGMACLMAVSNADTYVADLLTVQTMTTVPGVTDMDCSVDGYGYHLQIGVVTDNPVTVFGDNASNDFVRIRTDLRSNNGQIVLGIGGGWGTYTPLASNTDPANNFLSTPSDGWSTNWTAVSPAWFKSQTAPIGGFSPGLNWVMVRPDSLSTASPLQPDNQSFYTDTGAETNALVQQRAVAIGFIWTDVNKNDLFDNGDVFSSRWAISADTFAEMDTVTELNAIAVANNQPKPVGIAVTEFDSEIDLSWDNVADAAWGSYNVYRSEESGTNYTSVATGLTQPAYTNSGLVNGTTYYYVVTSVQTNGSESAYSDETSGTPTGAPQNLVATAGNATVSLDWDDSTNPLFGYYSVYRSEVSGSNYVLVASNLTASTHTDSGLVNGTTYYYVVTETDLLSYETPYSPEASATPAAPSLTVHDLTLATWPNNPIGSTYTYPIASRLIVQVMDPSDNSGFLGTFMVDFRDGLKTLRSQLNAWYAPSNKSGFTGSEVLSTDIEQSVVYLAPSTSGSAYYTSIPTDGEIFWFAQTAARENEYQNQTPYNDIAYGFRIIDQGTIGSPDAGDILELAGVIYSIGTGSVFGRTADELTALLAPVASPTPFETWTSDFGLSGDDAAAGFDFDGDGLVNLGEYAFGGNPTNSESTGEQPVMVMNGSGLQYVYRIVADTNVAHQVVTSTNLVVGGGSIGVTPLSTNEVGGFNIYSNAVDTSAEAKGFIHVEVSYQ